MEDGNPICPEEKFALIAVRCRTVDLPPKLALAPDLLASTTPPVDFGDHWKEWLGSIRAENFQRSHLFLLMTAPSARPDVLDEENHKLHERLRHFLVGLLLAGRTAFEKPDFLLGAYGSRGISVRRIGEHQAANVILGIGSDPITKTSLERAYTIAQQIDAWNRSGSAWRINSVLRNFVETRARVDVPDRIHQFCRCIEGFILPDVGRTARQFKSRTELFIGPGNHDLMGRMYDVRSEVEHLHYQNLIEPSGKHERIEITRHAAILEAVVRTCFTKLLSERSLWPYFRTDGALQRFWSLTDADRRALWGAAIPVVDLIADFQEQWITEEQLGLPACR